MDLLLDKCQSASANWARLQGSARGQRQVVIAAQCASRVAAICGVAPWRRGARSMLARAVFASKQLSPFLGFLFLFLCFSFVFLCVYICFSLCFLDVVLQQHQQQ